MFSLIKFYGFQSFAGSKESFEEPKILTKKIRQVLKMEKESSNEEANVSDNNTSSSTNAETKDEEPEKVQKCDKV